MTAGLAEPLSSKIRGEVRFDDVVRMLYLIDASVCKKKKPELILPRAKDDVVELVRRAVKQGVFILSRGG